MISLILRPTTVSGKPHIRWALQLRYNGPVETDYATIARVSDTTADEIVEAGKAYFMFDVPHPSDWQTQLDQLEPDEIPVDQLRFEILRLREKYDDKVEGMEADLDSALDVLWRRGDEESRIWIALNYKDKAKILQKLYGSKDEIPTS